VWVSKQVGGLNRRSKNELVWPTFQRYMRVNKNRQARTGGVKSVGEQAGWWAEQEVKE